MSLDELIANLEDLINRMVYVKDGDYVCSSHVNIFVDWIKDAIAVCKELYERFKERTGRTLPRVEDWLNRAESKHKLMRRVMYGDLVIPDDHNLIIDTLKLLEMSLREIEENL